MTSYENLNVEADGAFARLTINRPKFLNALDRATVTELGDAFESLDAAVRVVAITGAGEKSFVAGADIKEMVGLSAVEAASFSKLGHDTFAALESSDRVVIAEVNGFALGGGCELMLACDFAIASDRARFGQPEVALGVTPGFGGTTRLCRRVGAARARQMLLTGAQYKANEALGFGLVNEVVPAGDLRGRVDELALQIVKNAPLAVAWAKRSARVAEEAALPVANAYEREIFGMCFSTDDQTEGMTAFTEKRAARWNGR